MRKNGERDFIVGLDIGTSKVVAIVGEVGHNNEIVPGLDTTSPNNMANVWQAC